MEIERVDLPQTTTEEASNTDPSIALLDKGALPRAMPALLFSSERLPSRQSTKPFFLSFLATTIANEAGRFNLALLVRVE